MRSDQRGVPRTDRHLEFYQACAAFCERPVGRTEKVCGLSAGRYVRRMASFESSDEAKTQSSGSLLIKAVTGFWVLHLSYRTVIALLNRNLDEVFDPGLDLALGLGVLISCGYCIILQTTARRGLGFGLITAALLSFPASLLYASIELTSYYHLSPEVNGSGRNYTLPDGTAVEADASGTVTYRKAGHKPTTVKLSPAKEQLLAQAPSIVVSNATGWYFFYFGLGSFFVGMISAARLQRAERRAAEYERLAHTSQLLALRYQVNPHFLFNTLNSLSAMIMTRRLEAAERMILNLSSFFRSTLALDPTADITLAAELDLQRLYLDIESVRFRTRMAVELDVPDRLLSAQVPALILQPLAENAIKHGVSASTARVTIRIAASEASAGLLQLVITNEALEGRAAREVRDGVGVGLNNVAERLRNRFGNAASCMAESREASFQVTLRLPLVLE